MASNGVQPNTKEDQAAEKERMKKFANDLRQTVALKHILKKRGKFKCFSKIIKMKIKT